MAGGFRTRCPEPRKVRYRQILAAIMAWLESAEDAALERLVLQKGYAGLAQKLPRFSKALRKQFVSAGRRFMRSEINRLNGFRPPRAPGGPVRFERMLLRLFSLVAGLCLADILASTKFAQIPSPPVPADVPDGCSDGLMRREFAVKRDFTSTSRGPLVVAAGLTQRSSIGTVPPAADPRRQPS